MQSAAQARGGLTRTVFRNGHLEDKTKTSLAQSLAYSRLWHNAATWSAPAALEGKMFAEAMRLERALLGIPIRSRSVAL